MPVADLVEEWFEDASLRALVSTRGLFGVFAGPCSAGTTAVLLLRAAAGGGLVPRAPRVGVRTLIEALGTRARDLGVTIRLDTEATEILVEAHGVAGLRLRDGSHVAADLVVSGVGPTRTLVDLLDPMVLTPDVVRRAMHVRARGTLARALVLVDDPAGLATRDGTPLAPHVALHFVSSVDELERAFDAMKYGGWAERPWLEVRVHPPPAGASAANGPGALSVTAHQIPGAIEDGNWPGAQARLTDTILTTLGHHLPGLSARVVGCHVLTPHDLENELGLAGGHPLHAELALDQLWLARPALGLGGYRAAVAGLYLCGPGTHPGVGPLGTSGLLASRAAFRDLRRSSR
jgi:phytoene dehydrogenase-like protein